MTDLSHRLARLTPQQRAALEARLLTSPPTAAPIPRRAAGAEAPLSWAQERLWFLQRFDPADTAYNLHLVERLRGPVDVALLRRALATVVARHEVLRTGMPMRDGRPVQVVEPALDVPVTVVTVEGATVTDRESRARALVDEQVNTPFDLSRAPLLRVTLLRLGEDDHLFCLVLHHAVGDGWSLGLIADEVSRGYAALLAGADPDLPELPVQYADVAAWQRSRPDDAEQARRLDRLRQRVAAPPLALPTDRPRPRVRTGAGWAATRRLGPALSAAVAELARAERATVFMTLLAAYQVLLWRHSGQRTFLVGAPMAGRDRPEFRALVGCFTDTVLLRADLAGDPTFRQLLARVRDDALQAFADQGVPLEQLITHVGADRDTSRTPLFQAMFNLQPAKTGLLALPGVTSTPWEPTVRSVKVDVELDVNQHPDELEVQVGVSAALFDAGTAHRLAAHLATLLAGAVADPDRPISRLTLLDEAERRLVLSVGADTAAPYPARRLPELVAEQAARTPDAVALVAGGQQLSYRELDRRANGLAWRLRERGVRPRTPVAVLLPRDAELVVALLAVLKAGCHYVPLEPGHPDHRLREIVTDAAVTAVLTDDPGRWPDRLTIDPGRGRPEAADAPPPAPGGPDDLAYLIYTSGSTGRPKGVRVPHRGVVNVVTDVARTLRLGPTDRFLFLTSVSFDIAALEVFAPLLTGGAVVVAPESSVHAVDRVEELVRQAGVTTVQAPPSVLEALLPRLPAGLPRVISGGEALPAGLAERLLDRVGELWNFYGPTETTIWSTRARIVRGAPVTIGVPVANTAAYVLDERWQPVPVGCPGELYLAGDGLARDYHRGPALTAERFLPDPYGARPGGRMYRTGDLVRLREDGHLEFLGRIDDQVKLGGVRIEPGEVEAALAEHPRVRRAVVVLRDDLPAGRGLVAYLDWTGDDDPAPTLRAHLRARLPEAMIPSAFVALATFPVLASGKLDRAALPAPTLAPAPAEAPSRPPRTDGERLVAEVFAEVLGRETVDADDDFFALGGTSLLAVRVLAELGATTELDIPLRTLFTHRTVGQLAAAVEEMLAAELAQLSEQEASRLVAEGG